MTHLEILLVDDDPLIRHVIADELEEVGHFVTPAVGPEAAIELLRESDAFDLILIDYTMPGMSGSDLARHILALKPDAKRMALAHDASATRVDLLVDQISTKPTVGGVASGMGATFDAAKEEALPDAFASILERMPNK